MMTAILRGEVARVVVWRLDQLGRTAKGLVELRVTMVPLTTSIA